MTFHTRILAIISLTSTSALLFNSCQGTAIDNSNTAVDTAKNDTTGTGLPLINEFPLKESMMTASQSYKVVPDDDPSMVSYITMSTSVQWPETIGRFKITNLQDSIISLTFGAMAPEDVKKAIRQSVTDLETYGLSGKITPVDTVPQNVGADEFYSVRSLQLIECTQQTVTYSATYSDYMGGAHPNSGATPFTFDLESDRPVTMEYLFRKGAIKAIMPKIMQAIADTHSMTYDELKNSLLNSPETITGNVYLLNGNIAFHYNPYDILPYSFGATEAYISPIEVEQYLTPEAKKLLLD